MSTLEAITVKRGPNGVTKMDMEQIFDDVELQSLYRWIDSIPLSREKKNISKDFADGVMVAEIIRHYFPRMVDTHNYIPAIATNQRKENWYLLNRKVLKRLSMALSDDIINKISLAKPQVIEKVLMLLRTQIDKTLERLGKPSNSYASPRLSPTENMSQLSHRKNRNATDLPIVPTYKKGEMPHSHPDRSFYSSKSQTSLRHPSSYSLKSKSSFNTDVSYIGSQSIKSYTLPPISDNVPRAILEERQMECDAKDETINILHSKIKRLEHLLHLKDLRLDDLENRLFQIQSLGKIDKS